VDGVRLDVAVLEAAGERDAEEDVGSLGLAVSGPRVVLERGSKSAYDTSMRVALRGLGINLHAFPPLNAGSSKRKAEIR
jgi:hypothetical protein